MGAKVNRNQKLIDLWLVMVLTRVKRESRAAVGDEP